MTYLILIMIGWVVSSGLLMIGFYKYFGRKYKMIFFFDSLRKGELNSKEIFVFILYIFMQIFMLLVAGVLAGYIFMIGAVG